MQGKHLYEYALIRIVPRVEREEFVNVGILLCSKKVGFFQCLVHLDEQKLKALDAEVDLELIHNYLNSIKGICAGSENANPISKLDSASRFRWLTATRSSMIQTSPPHSGFSEDLDKTLKDLFQKYVQ